MSEFDSRVVTQVGIVVRDIEASVAHYSRVFSVEKPPIRITAEQEKSGMKFVGEPSQGRAKLAFFKMGQVEIELIEPIGGPSTWQYFLETKGEGVHHIAFVTKDIPKLVGSLAQEGIEEVQKGEFEGGRYSYLDSTPELGVMLELLEFYGR